jgi:hypothetical protein
MNTSRHFFQNLFGTMLVLVLGCISLNAQWSKAGNYIYPSTITDNVGIGIAAPASLLHLKKTTDNAFLTIESTASQKFAGINLIGWNGSNSATSQIYMDYYGATGFHGLNYISGRSGFSNHWFKDYSGAIQMCIINSGYVGIGTNTPAALLSLKGTSPKILLEESDQSNKKWNIEALNSGLVFSETGVSDWLYLKSGGNIGIGCSNPMVKLAVNGKIQATEIEIKSAPCADFVFKEDYNLRPISAVESFIKANNHLPDVPSEKEVKENGINLGQMDAILLQKVEELTLYVIELQKENDSQKKEIQELQQKVGKSAHK